MAVDGKKEWPYKPLHRTRGGAARTAGLVQKRSRNWLRRWFFCPTWVGRDWIIDGDLPVCFLTIEYGRKRNVDGGLAWMGWQHPVLEDKMTVTF